MVDPIDYGAPLRASLLTGLQGGTMLQGLGIRTQQMRQAQAQQEAQQQFQRDWQQAYSSGDPAALDAIVAKYPQQMETVQKAIGFRDDNHRMALGNAARDLRIAAVSGNPEAFAQMAMKNRAALQSVGSTPEELIQQYQQDPQGTQRIIDVVGMGALGIKEYYDLQDKNAGQQLTARGQDVQMRGQDIQADLGYQRLDLDREANRINYENKKLDRQLRVETNDLRRQQLQQQITVNNQKLQEQQQKRNDSYRNSVDTLTTSMNTLNQIITSPALSRITGLKGALPNIPGSEASNVQAQLETFKSQAFLSAVQSMKGLGSLSDAEGKKLDAAVGALQNSQSEAAFKKNAQTILNLFSEKRKDFVQKYVRQNGLRRVEAPAASVEHLKKHPELSMDFVNRYGYLPSLGG